MASLTPRSSFRDLIFFLLFFPSVFVALFFLIKNRTASPLVIVIIFIITWDDLMRLWVDVAKDFVNEFLPRWLAGLAVSKDLIKVLVCSHPL